MTLTLPGREICPGIVGGQQQGHLVGGLTLAEKEAGALNVACDVRHHGMPGIMVVENSGGIQRPAGLAYLWRGIGPAMADDLIDANEEV